MFRPFEPILRPLGVAILLVAAYLLWVPNPMARRAEPAPSCEALAAEFAYRFQPLALGRQPLMEERVLRLTLPDECTAAWSVDPPRAWSLVGLDTRPRPREVYRRPGHQPDPVPDERPGRYLQPNALA